MKADSALKTALATLHMPSSARALRDKPLPSGVPALLRVAAGDAGAIASAEAETGRQGPVLVEAARFYVEQVLWHAGADSYRVLGATADASAVELKRNMALLMTWLHPDMDQKDDRSVFVARVTSAWNDLKTEERRADYARMLGRSVQAKSPKSGRSRRRGPLAQPGRSGGSPRPRSGLMARLIALLLGQAHR